MAGDTALTAEHFSEEDERNHAILHVLKEHEGPVGSGQVALALRRLGLPLSEATVGRLLRELELKGALTKCGRQGRTLTDRGLLLYERLSARRTFSEHSRELDFLLQSANQEHVLHVLAARRAIESETAALASRYATPAEIEYMEHVVAESARHLKEGNYSAEDDNNFHNAIAQASQNPVLAAVVRLVRESEGVSYVLMQIRHHAGHQSLADHEAIVQAIRKRDADVARAAMLSHIERVRADAVRVWARSSAGAAERGGEAGAASPGFMA